MRIVPVFAALILLGSSLLGCGLRGPLYIPEPAKPVELIKPNANKVEANEAAATQATDDDATAAKQKTPQAMPAPQSSSPGSPSQLIPNEP